MVAVINDPQLQQQLIEERGRTGADKYDEVWEGVYMMAPTTEQSPVKITETSLDQLRRLVEEAPGTVYAILDACDEPCVPVKVKELGPERGVCLYRGSAEEEYWAIAPYLVVVDIGLLDWIVKNLWDDPWGIFVVAPVDLASLRKHFRRFLIVKDPDGKEMFFRFYDPRVLPTFCLTCVACEVDDFFGSIKCFVCSDGEKELRVLSRADRESTQGVGKL